MEKLEIKEGHLPDFSISITDESDSAFDLSSYDGVKFLMINDKGEVIINRDGAFVGDKTEGKIKYDFQAGDTDTPGDYKAYFSLTINDVKKISAPTDYFHIVIKEDFID